MVDNQRTNDQQYIGSLANEHQTVTQAVDSTFLLDRLPAQTALIQAAYTYFSRQSDNGITHIRAAEWLLDNYYLVRQTQEQIQQDLPASYYVELPKLASGVFKHYPRVYALVHHIVCDTQANLEVQRFIQLVEDYQQVIPLTMGEVWALPIMWRFCLLESLAQAVGRLCGLLPDDADMDPALQFNFTVDEADYVAIVIHGLRSINDVNWQDFFETVSRVEQTLRHDPAQIYPDMDFDSRNRYRSVIEDLAKASRQDEVSVAQCAVALAQDAYDHEADSFEVRDDWYGLQLPADSHVGHYLYGDGRSALEQRMGYSPQGVSRIQRWHYNYPGLLYFGAIGLLTTLIGVLVTMYAVQASGLWLLWVVIPVLVAIPVISAVVHLVNWTVTHTIPPRVLPKIDFQEGIPASCRTVIVVPSLLSNPGTVRSLLSQIEQHYLRNVDENLSFALLTDFVDAPQQTMPDDEPLLTAVVEGIEGLNRQYPAAPFYLCHRPRLWNAGESTWMGWERKRGKLHEFNQFLLTGKDESYSTIVGDVQALHRIRYVITLDADTILPYDSARRLVGTLAHPLNRAQFDAVGNVVAGYTVLQPRIEIMPTSVNETHFTRLFAQNAGVDLYTLAVSDVYQDLFGEGIYAGKGIYDVRAFERSLTGCVPVNTLLSHDLFEGINGRSALVTDVILYEDYPPSYPAYVRRMERWVRGDWQLLPWLLARYPCKPKQPHKTLTLLDRWKITDNLRRSILTPALVVLFVTGWLWLPGSPWLWTLLGLGLSAVLFLTEAVDVSLRSLNRTMSHGVRRTLQDCLLRWLFWLSVVPYDAWYAVRAIAITLTRLLVTRRHRLQWVTAATMTTLVGKKLTPRTALTQMWGLPAMSLALGLLMLWLNPTALIPASLVLVLWALAPVLIAHTSQPITHDNEQLSAPQVKQLRRLARHTWLYFEHFVGPDDHWLPPDHYQQAPREVVAHRTSPTNTGLYLLSVLSAYDLGYLNAIEMSFRLRFTFDTLAQLERYRGHFRNWIDTRNLHPLNPAYISTVDSGNLAASLIAVK